METVARLGPESTSKNHGPHVDLGVPMHSLDKERLKPFFGFGAWWDVVTVRDNHDGPIWKLEMTNRPI